jgi:pimeloyl-ACP methyl ester carboxylesterase
VTTPLRFGPPARQLFALSIPPAAGTERDHGVLLCNPFGQEAIRCHRLYRVLGERLAREGFHVLRFDYQGTGDSDGDERDGDLDAWSGDVLRADAELARISRCRERSWFGLRLGATLAATASARATQEPRNLVLWDPVVDGAAYLAELALAHDAEMSATYATMPWTDGGWPEPPRAQGVEFLGYPLSPRLVEGMRGLSAATFAQARAARVSLLDSGTTPGTSALAFAPGTRRSAPTALRTDAPAVWSSDEAMNTAVVPAEALRAITAQLAEA